jgi:hypothetical protein
MLQVDAPYLLELGQESEPDSCPQSWKDGSPIGRVNVSVSIYRYGDSEI